MDTLGIIRQLRADPALADELRAALLSQDFLELPERIGRLEERVAKLDERIGRLEERVAKLDERIGRLEERVAKLDERIGRLEERVAKLDERLAKLELQVAEMEARLTRRLERVEHDTAALKGMLFEARLREDPRHYLSKLARRAVLAAPEDFDLSALDEVDADYLRDIDAVVRGQQPGTGQDVMLAVEVSWAAHQDDLDKVARRARLLARASGELVLPVVVSHDPPAQVVIDHAQAAGIALVVAGGSPPLSEGSPRAP
jgi:vacuolar-type H+-ATPase subunit I/STV1